MADRVLDGRLELREDEVGASTYHLDGERLSNGDGLSVTLNGLRSRGVFSWSGLALARPRLASRFWRGGSVGFNFPIGRDASCAREAPAEPAGGRG